MLSVPCVLPDRLGRGGPDRLDHVAEKPDAAGGTHTAVKPAAVVNLPATAELLNSAHGA
jgi:hypothetical protein